jgi:phage N-6-adenine-methyltransferase
MPRKLATVKGSREVDQFDPERYRLKVAALDYGIVEARRIKDWPALEEAVDRKIEEQTQFVTWWSGAVRGDGRPEKNEPRTRFVLKEAEDLTGMRQQRVSDLSKRLKNVPAYRGRLLGTAYHAAMLEFADSQLVQQSLSNEHYTPEKYIEAARAVLGEIDLDPASCAEANETVCAAKYYSADDDGLHQSWHGRVWLNPPYGDLVGKFIGKLAEEIKSENVSSAVVLVNAHCTDTLWFRPLWEGCLCFTDHRINFAGDATRSGSTHGRVFVYFGSNRDVFGACVVRA